MTAILGIELPVFVGMTLILMGGAALLLGQSLAMSWRPMWQVLFYSVLLGIATRFLSLALFVGDPFFQPLQWLHGIVIDSVCHMAYALFAYRMTMVSKMLAQYPWLYERSGLFGYREKAGHR